jgi:hypothetical protein
MEGWIKIQGIKLKITGKIGDDFEFYLKSLF